MMEEYYTGLEYAFVPELAITSCPSVESIKKFIPEGDLWPPGPSWGYHWADLDILRIHNYEILNDQHTNGFEEFVNATQIAQGVYFQYSSEHFRRMKPKNSGVSLCHFILHTPDMKWAIVDFYGEPKLSFDYVQRAFQPLLVSLEHHKRRWNPGETFNGKVWVVNDLYTDFSNCSIEVKFLDHDKQVVKKELLKIGKVSGDSAKSMADVSLKVPGEKGDMFHVQLKLLDAKGKSLSENEYFLLVDDYEESRAMMKAMGKEADSRKNRAWRTIRYFPELMGDDYVPTKLIEDFE
jgi:beta-mannosidase